MLEDKKLFILDMDGTVYLGDRLFPETLPFLERITSSGKRYLFFTNNASAVPSLYVTMFTPLLLFCSVVPL